MKKVPKNAPAGVYKEDKKKGAEKPKQVKQGLEKIQGRKNDEESYGDQSDRKDSQDFNHIQNLLKANIPEVDESKEEAPKVGLFTGPNPFSNLGSQYKEAIGQKNE